MVAHWARAWSECNIRIPPITMFIFAGLAGNTPREVTTLPIAQAIMQEDVFTPGCHSMRNGCWPRESLPCYMGGPARVTA